MLVWLFLLLLALALSLLVVLMLASVRETLVMLRALGCKFSAPAYITATNS